MIPPPPSQLFGPLFEAVQEQALFHDSKTFADATPLRDPAAILADWQALAPADPATLRHFVHANFRLPEERPMHGPAASGLSDYIAGAWPMLTREPTRAGAGASLLDLPRRYVVPGGRFRELYYWDSYFTMLGLTRSGRQDLVEDMIADFGDLIDRYGHIPNGTRTYYLTRSHPPVLYLMAGLSTDHSEAARRRRLGWMRRERAFWMAGADDLTPGEAHRRVVRLADGTLLNRYWDDSDSPRDESWREDVALARTVPDRDPHELWRDLRAAAESGWDFSSRWLADHRSLGTIRTTRLLPVDLNALLFGLERTIANEAADLGEPDAADRAQDAAARREAIERYLWDDSARCYADYDLDTGASSDQLTCAAAFPLFTGAAARDRGQATAAALAELLRPGGLAATAQETGEQWDAPNGWAPLQWIAVAGLRQYGEHALADAIASRWLAMVDRHYREHGELVEKYDVQACTGGGGGEYGLEVGFGWTNGVTLALSDQDSR